MTWTQFWDMHSGGRQKLAWHKIYIEAPLEEAKSVFYARFGRNPKKVTCTCCGEDYSLEQGEDLAQLTAYHRNCRYDHGKGMWVEEPDRRYDPTAEVIPLEEYRKDSGVFFIEAEDIQPDERNRTIPMQGYVWQD
jgi:hypothetical protein